MDLATITAVLTSVVTVASLLTNVIPTPGPSAAAWQRYSYQALEWLALVTARAKANPAAIQAASTAYVAATRGDLAVAAASASAAYTALTGDPAAASAQAAYQAFIGKPPAAV